MRGPCTFIALLAVICGCSEEQFAYTSFGSEDAALADAGPADGNDGGGDSGPPGPELEPADIAHPEPAFSGCTRLDEGEGRPAGLFSYSGRWFAFFTEGLDYASPLNLRIAEAGEGRFGDSVRVLAGARQIDLVQQQDGSLLGLASRQLYAVLLESEEGLQWTELGNVAPDEPAYYCEGFPPARFFRAPGEVAYLAMGHDYNTGLFGCQDRLFVSSRQEDGWSMPEHIGSGDAVFGYQQGEHLILVSTFGIYLSDDGGASFSKQEAAGPTAFFLAGSGTAWIDGRLVLAQNRSLQEMQALVLLFGEQFGSSWPRGLILRSWKTSFNSPLVASDGDFIAVAWQQDAELWVMTSPDRGLSWSRPGLFQDTAAGSRAPYPVYLAVSGSRVALMALGEGVLVCLGAGG